MFLSLTFYFLLFFFLFHFLMTDGDSMTINNLRDSANGTFVTLDDYFPLTHPDHNSEEHLEAQVPHQDEEAGSIVFLSNSNASEFKNDNKEARVTASAAAKVSEDFPNEDAEILRLIEERRSAPNEEK